MKSILGSPSNVDTVSALSVVGDMMYRSLTRCSVRVSSDDGNDSDDIENMPLPKVAIYPAESS
jgi:hypothetical protein